MATLRILILLSFIYNVTAKGSEAQVECTPEVMKVTVPMDGDRRIAHLDQMGGYRPCLPEMNGKSAIFVLDLQDPHKCGVTRVLSKMTGKKTFYHKIVVKNADSTHETITVRCSLSGKLRSLSRREVKPFPLDFDEPEDLNITRFEEGNAPEPILGAVVKQNGKQVSGEISVSPGTPLSLEIFLNNESASVYGLSVNYMHVTDTGKQQETIILNGCSVDPYLFDNFVTEDGDTLTAKFRAFKFPESSYVQFRGNVNVCLDKCPGVQCSNGVTGYGRRRRSIAPTPESNKLYEVALTTFIQVKYADGESKEAEELMAVLKNLKVANQRLGSKEGTQATVAEHTDNKLILHPGNFFETINHSNIVKFSCLLTTICLIINIFK